MFRNGLFTECVCIAALVSAAACSPDPQAAQVPADPSSEPTPVAVSTAPASYACETGQVVEVQYADSSTAQLKHRNRIYMLRTAATPTGVRLIGSGIEWMVVTGDGLERATLSRLGPNDQVGTAVMERCSRPISVTPTVPAPDPVPDGATPVAARPCRGPQLKLDMESGDAGAGNRVAVIGVQNISTRVCTLTGYPTVTLMDGQGRALSTVRAEQGPGNYFRTNAGPTQVLLAPQGKAFFDLAWNVVPHEGDGETVCPTAARVKMTAPGDTSPSTLTLGTTPCGGRVRVSPFRSVAEVPPEAGPSATTATEP
ncbi:DUF4232 domain-containing protein [Rhizobium sp. CRIBSB]|nr:DUF4232 domain-containing protein [Rhizobium sp. CRIBSB]